MTTPRIHRRSPEEWSALIQATILPEYRSWVASIVFMRYADPRYCHHSWKEFRETVMAPDIGRDLDFDTMKNEAGKLGVKVRDLKGTPKTLQPPPPPSNKPDRKGPSLVRYKDAYHASE